MAGLEGRREVRSLEVVVWRDGGGCSLGHLGGLDIGVGLVCWRRRSVVGLCFLFSAKVCAVYVQGIDWKEGCDLLFGILLD